MSERFQDRIENLSLSDFCKMAKNLKKFEGKNVFLEIYPAIIKFSKKAMDDFDEMTLPILAHIAYAWMPTMLKNIELVKNSNELKKKIEEGNIDESFIEEFKKITNNSVVGASKLLHFINPKQYAIFDSRVYKSIVPNNTTVDANNTKKFCSYIKQLRVLIENDKNKTIETIKGELINKQYYASDDYSEMRILELCLFQYNGGK